MTNKTTETMNTINVCSPFNGQLIKEIPLLNQQQVDEKLSRAYALFQDRSRWLKPYQRIEILEKTKVIMQSRVEELTKIAASEGETLSG